MNEEIKYPFAKASKVATYILQLLQPHCEINRCHIAGSIRRCSPEVKDIELVCIPKKEQIQNGLFPEDSPWQTVKEFTAALATITKQHIKGSVEGHYMQLITTSENCPGIKLDLFIPRPDDYWRQYAIRTGNADYAHHVIAAAWSRKGWVGIKGELRKRSECDCKIQNDKKVYTIKKEKIHVSIPPAWESEGEFFSWLDLPYLDPEHRIVSLSNPDL